MKNYNVRMAIKYCFLLLFVFCFDGFKAFCQNVLKKEEVALQYFLDSLLETELRNYRSVLINSETSGDYSDFILHPDCFKQQNLYGDLKSAIKLLPKYDIRNRENISISTINDSKILFKKIRKKRRLKYLQLFVEVNKAVFANSNYYVSIDITSREYLYQYFFEISNKNQVLKWCKQEVVF